MESIKIIYKKRSLRDLYNKYKVNNTIKSIINNKDFKRILVTNDKIRVIY